jgi:DNA-directed RNA polymerase beta' subunit
MASQGRFENIRFIQFGILSAEEWRSIGIEITKPYTRDGDKENTPYDPRLGALDNGVDCNTCGETNSVCPGHFGYVNLEEPMYNPVFMPYVIYVLRCICIKCFKPKISPDHVVWSGISAAKKKSRMKVLKKCEKISICRECRSTIPMFNIDKKDKNNIYMKIGNKSILISPKEIITIFIQISDETLSLLGFNDGLSQNDIFFLNGEHVHKMRPESMIFQVLPIMPPPARPWVIKGGERDDDDITKIYNAIIKCNIKLKDKKADTKRKKVLSDLQNHIWTLIDNSKEKSNGSNNRTHKGIKDRLIKKDGHIQNNIGGKRVDFSARSVIVSGGLHVPMGTIGIPEECSTVATENDVVTKWNKSYYERLLEEKKINTIIREGKKIDVKTATGEGAIGINGLRERDVVERHLVSGDWGLFNRQPTLKIESIQGVQMSIMKGEWVFRLPPCMTRAFNADYDGDYTKN